MPEYDRPKAPPKPNGKQPAVEDESVDYNKMWFELKSELQRKTNWGRNQLYETMRKLEMKQID